MSSALAALSLRRALPRRFLILAIAIAAAIVATARPTGLGEGGALRREGAWAVLAITLLPFVVHRAACAIPRWRAGEIDWLAKSPAPRAAVIAAAACGIATGVIAVLVGIAAVAELSAWSAGGDRSDPQRRISSSRLEGPCVLDGREPARWTVERPRGARRARVELAYVPLDVFADVEMAVRDPRSGERRSTVARVTARTSIAVDAPADVDSAQIELELRRLGGGGIALLAEARVDWLGPAPSARLASLSLFAHAALAALAAAAIAFGLGSWMGPMLATGSTVSLALLGALVGPRAAALWPTMAFVEALDIAGRGVVPEAPGAATALASAAAAAAGLALAWLGTRRWRTGR